ncbi:MAG: alpha/beta hydrolase, partial [Methanoregula sp.]
MIRGIGAGLACLVVLALIAGCTSSTPPTPSYSVDSNGVLSVTCAPVTSTETVLFSNETYTKSRFVLHTTSGDVITYLSYPKTPKAVMVYIPGAGETISGHEERMIRYAEAGYAFMFVDTRGRGQETAGYAFDPATDYAKFKAGNPADWPEYYLTI